jgi:hypothetical protein
MLTEDRGPVQPAYNPYFFSLFFQSEQYFSLTKNQKKQCFNLFFSTSDGAIVYLRPQNSVVGRAGGSEPCPLKAMLKSTLR